MTFLLLIFFCTQAFFAFNGQETQHLDLSEAISKQTLSGQDIKFYPPSEEVPLQKSPIGALSADLSECPDMCICMHVGKSKIFLDCSAVGGTKIPNGFPSIFGIQVIELHLNKNCIEKLLANSFDQFPRITSLSVSDNIIGFIDGAAFHGLQCLKHLVLMTNSIGDLPDGVFASLGKTLLSLNLLGAGLNSINPAAFYNLSQLLDLDLSINSFEILPPYCFEHLTALKRLKIKKTRLSTIDQRTFVGLKNLEHLDLTESHLLQYLPDLVFSYMPSIKYINLCSARVNPINPYAFVNISKELRQFDIKCNHFQILPYNLSQQLWMLQNLDISCNDLGTSDLDARSFNGLTNLKSLSMNDNSISILPKDIFLPLVFLEWLDLSSNKLTTLDSRWFMNLEILQILNLSANGIDDISNLTGSHEKFLPKLKILRLSHNAIKLINISSLRDLHSLSELDLSCNHIKKLYRKPTVKWNAANSGSFTVSKPAIKLPGFTGRKKVRAISQLKIIDFSVNYLHDIGIKENYLGELSNLQELYLKSNQIESLSQVTFQGLHSLAVLDLSGNPISTISDGTFSNIPISMLFLSHIGASTLNPVALTNLTTLAYLDLSYNKFKSIPDFLDKNNQSVVPNLKNLELVSNPIENISFTSINHCNGLKNLKKLTLDIIQIRNLKNCTFAELKNLEFLSFEGNNMLSVDRRAFESPSLQHVKLIDSFLPSSSFRFLDEIQNVHSLDLSSCKLPSQESLAVNFNMSMLKSLNLSDTSISLDEHSFEQTVMLETLILNKMWHRIAFLDRRIFTNLRSLKTLHLKDTGIETMNITSLPNLFWTNLSEIDLSYNPYKCDCNIVWFRKWLKSPRMKVIGINDHHAYICVSPDTYRGVSIRQLTRDFDFNCFLKQKNNYVVGDILIILAVFIIMSGITAVFHRYRCYISYMMLFVRARMRADQGFHDEKTYRYDAFVMYSQQDQPWVLHQLLPNLERPKGSISLCIHERDWLGGRWIHDNIIDSIEDSQKCLLIVSNAFTHSHWCHCEMSLAQASSIRQDKNNIILVLLEEIAHMNMTPTLRFQMENYTYIEWVENVDGQQLFWARLKQALRGTMRRVSTAPPSCNMIAAAN